MINHLRPLSHMVLLVVAIASSAAGEEQGKGEGEQSAGVQRVTLEVARDRAELMHEIYSATLDVIHHRYFRGDRAMVPARALEDVFEELERKTNSKARWFAVNLKPMSVNHEPKTDFEIDAAKRLSDNQEPVEGIETSQNVVGKNGSPQSKVGRFSAAISPVVLESQMDWRAGCLGFLQSFLFLPTNLPRGFRPVTDLLRPTRYPEQYGLRGLFSGRRTAGQILY